MKLNKVQTKLTYHSYTSFVQAHVFGLLRDLNVSTAIFFDLLNVIARFPYDHAGSGIRYENLHLPVAILHLVLRFGERFPQVGLLTDLLHDEIEGFEYRVDISRYQADSFRGACNNRNDMKFT